MYKRQPATTRRSVVAALGTGIIGVLAGCAGGTGGGRSEFQNQIETVRDATAKYTDYEKALGEGFIVLGPFVPGMGWHFAHPQRLRDAAKNGFSLEKPQLITYDAEMNLGAVEWGAPKGAVDGTPDLFADEDADATEEWHTHEAATHVFAVPDGKRTAPKNVAPEQFLTNGNWAEFRPPASDLKPGETASLHWGSLEAKQTDPKEERVVDIAQSHPDLTTLHAWVHVDNPDGVLNPSNSEFAQSMGPGGHSH